jgi:hypothetical protein
VATGGRTFVLGDGSLSGMTSVLPRASVEVLDNIVAAVTNGQVAPDAASTSVELDGLVFDDPGFDDPDFADDPEFAQASVMAPAETPKRELTERQRGMLVFERLWWRHAGSKEQAIREQFDLSATRYYQMLNRLLEMPEALAFDPLVVGRLRRLRATRSRARMAT